MRAQELAGDLGFPEEDVYRAGLVTTELATNLVKHARSGGDVLLAARSATREFEVIAIDRGPGLNDLSASMRDGHSTSGSLGLGLGGVRRLADSFDIHSTPGKGTAVVARVRQARTAAPGREFQLAGLSIARPGESICGDAWVARVDGRSIMCLVADGLGHGPGAADASYAAVRAFIEAPFSDVPAVLDRIHDALRSTRGAAASILRIERASPVARFAGVGNVSGVICRNGSARQAVSSNGTLGQGTRTVREYTYPWDDEAIFVLHSDGLASHWSLDSYPGLQLRDPALVAAVLYRDFCRGRDDVTVVVGRETP